MIIHNINKLPPGEGNYYKSDNLSRLDEYDLKHIPKDVEEIWYWYVQGSYDGDGHILMRSGDLYDTSDMGHCSCNGPTDGLTFNGLSINDLILSMSFELCAETVDLFQAAMGWQ